MREMAQRLLFLRVQRSTSPNKEVSYEKPGSVEMGP